MLKQQNKSEEIAGLISSLGEAQAHGPDAMEPIAGDLLNMAIEQNDEVSQRIALNTIGVCQMLKRNFDQA
jgi:hypothetical protein